MNNNPITLYYDNLLNKYNHCVFSSLNNIHISKSIAKYISDKCNNNSNCIVYCFNCPTIFNCCLDYLDNNNIIIRDFQKYHLKNNSKILYFDIDDKNEIEKLNIKTNIIIFDDNIYDIFENKFESNNFDDLLNNCEKFIFRTMFTKSKLLDYLKNNFIFYYNYKNRNDLKNIIKYIREEKIRELKII